ncbi:MAG: homocysteine S-methyltransferase family protein [Thermoguttaceae bacterium]|nr:homocysteine S-methyltransferase family protein [Thermoguttaceae bacterium]
MTISTKLQKKLQQKTILLDGGWGTELQKLGLPVGAHPDLWCLENPDAVASVARSYVEAGSDVVLTNTFGSSRFVLDKHGLADKVAEINKRGAEISVEAAANAKDRDVVVFASVGPTGVMLALGAVQESEIYDAYLEQMTALKEGGVEAVVLETSSDPQEAAQGVKAAKELGLFVAVTAVFDSGRNKDRTMMGATPEAYIKAVESVGADVVGSNCGRGIESFAPICKRMREATQLPIWMKGNAGLPQTVDGVTTYAQTAEAFADGAVALLDEGATFIGGCCGTTPAFIAELRRRIDARG